MATTSPPSSFYSPESLLPVVVLCAVRLAYILSCNSLSSPTLLVRIYGVAAIARCTVHGSCASYRQFEPQMWTFQRRFNIVAYDAHGCGAYAAQAPDDWASYAEDELYADALAVVKTFGSPTRMNVIVGHSFGCVLTARVAASEVRDRIAGITVVGAAYDRPAGATHPVFRLPVFALRWLQPKLSAGFVRSAFHPDTSEELKVAESEKTAGNQMHMAKAFYRQMRWDCHDAYASLDIPTMLITGDADQLTPVQQSRKVEAAVTGSVLHVVRKAGHQVMVEQPERVNELLEQFLAGVFRSLYVPPLAVTPPVPAASIT